MDSKVQLALMAKAQKVFGNTTTFLSFPVTPLLFTKQQLSFLSDQNLQNLETFSLLVNLIPNGEAWIPTEARYLWDVYEEVFREATIAESIRTQEEETQYQKAFHYLYSVKENGLRENSEFFRVYRQYRDQWFVLSEKYKEAQSKGEFSTDHRVKIQWKEVDEPQLRAEIASLETLWATQGYRREVEAAQETIARLGAKSPSLTWAQWHKLFNPDIDMLTSVNNLSYYPSSFNPFNALEEGAWQTFTLTEDEVNELVKQAPVDLRNRLSTNSGDSQIASLTFEFSSAIVERHWFESDVFKACFWQFSDPSKALSDGKAPPSGLCTAYVTAVIFARNVSIKAKPTSSGDARNRRFNGFNFPIIVKQKRSAGIETPPVIPQPHPIALFSRSGVRVELTNARTRGNTSQAFLRLQQNAFTRPEVLQKEGRLVGSDSGRPQPSQPSSNDAIYILAFICKRLSQCPNPDPALQW